MIKTLITNLLRTICIACIMLTTGYATEKQQEAIKTLDFDHLPANQILRLTLPDAIAMALRKNPDIEQAYIQRALDKINLENAKLDYSIQPTLSVSPGTVNLKNNLENELSTSVTPGFSWQSRWGTEVTGSLAFTWDTQNNPGYQTNLIITQKLLKGFGEAVNTKALRDAEDNEIINRLSLKSKLITEIGNVLSQYRGLQEAEQNLITSQKNYQSNLTNLENTKISIKAGTKAPSELNDAETNLAKAQVGILRSRATLNTAQVNLANILGLGSDVRIEVPTDVEVPQVTPDLKLSYQLALSNSPSYLQDLINLRLQKRSLLEQRDNARWSADLSLKLNKDLNQPGGLVSLGDSSTLGLNINIPVGAKTALSHKVAITRARISVQNALRSLQTFRRDKFNDIRNRIINLQVAWDTIQQSEKALAFQLKTEKSAKLQYERGLISLFRLNAVLDDTTNRRTEVTSDKASYLQQLQEFDALLGTTLETWHVNVNY